MTAWLTGVLFLMSENPLVNLAGILFPLIGLIKILRHGIQQSTYQFDLGNFYAR
jgi:hypothetical protein